MNQHEQLYESAERSIDQLFEDTTVQQETTRQDLETLAQKINDETLE